MFYNWPGRYAEIRAFSGFACKTHVPDRAMKIAEIRNVLNQAGVCRLYGHEDFERIICLVLRP
jgi:hypothetical protein